MKNLAAIAKRAHNAATVLASFWLIWVTLVAVGTSKFSMDIFNDFFMPAITAYALVGISNYIFFGKFTFWHKGVSAQGPSGQA